ncbi:MAG: hypothetical protein E7609_01320 [Ruminococcaceae bacterium]|nr:hypothetical protein [Oscillospiraceae bacterium]
MKALFVICVIAGYSGEKRVAPILIEMLKKIEYFDGGYATGIATIHEGKLYYAKAKGDADMLLKMTDALDLPGTTGIIHSRPGFDFFSTTPPFLDRDERLALVTNGTSVGTSTKEFYEEQRRVADELCDAGVHSRCGADIKPEGFYEKFMAKDGKIFWAPELRAYPIGLAVANEKGDKSAALVRALKASYERLPADQVSVMIHADIPDIITLCTVTRPMSVLEADGATYIASCALAFPENVEGKVTHLPQCSLAQITPNGFSVLFDHLDGVRCEPVTEEIIAAFTASLEKQIGKGGKPLSVYELELPNVWHEPMVDCDRFRVEGGKLKPNLPAFYQTVYRLYKEGRLSFATDRIYARDVVWPSVDCYFTKFSLN